MFHGHGSPCLFMGLHFLLCLSHTSWVNILINLFHTEFKGREIVIRMYAFTLLALSWFLPLFTIDPASTWDISFSGESFCDPGSEKHFPVRCPDQPNSPVLPGFMQWFLGESESLSPTIINLESLFYLCYNFMYCLLQVCIFSLPIQEDPFSSH